MPGYVQAEAELEQASRLPDQCCDQLQATAISQPVAGPPGQRSQAEMAMHPLLFAAFSLAGVLYLAFY